MNDGAFICPWCEVNIEAVVDDDGKRLWRWEGRNEFRVDCPACGKPFEVFQVYRFNACKIEAEGPS